MILRASMIYILVKYKLALIFLNSSEYYEMKKNTLYCENLLSNLTDCKLGFGHTGSFII